MNIAIIEDSKADSAVLLALLDQFFAKYDFTPGIDTYGDAENFLTAFEPGKYDLCFMDIHLPGMNGMDAARQGFSYSFYGSTVISCPSENSVITPFSFAA